MAPELQFNNYFARVHYDYVLKNIQRNEEAMRGTTKKRELSAIELNKVAWSRTKDPLVEFVNRQNCPLFEEKLTIGAPERVRKACF